MDDQLMLSVVERHVFDGQLGDALASWTNRMEDQIVQVMGLQWREADKARGRAKGQRFVTKPALGGPGSQHPRGSMVTVAWRSAAGWLLAIQHALGSPAQGLAKASIRAKWRLQNHHWNFPKTSKHSEAFLSWLQEVRGSDFTNRDVVAQRRLTAKLVATAAAIHDDRRAQAAWHTWIRDGPARGLGRQHRLSRITCGWIPSAAMLVGEPTDQARSNLLDGDEGDQIQEDLDGVLLGVSCMPQSSQQAVDAEAAKWTTEWQAGAQCYAWR